MLFLFSPSYDCYAPKKLQLCCFNANKAQFMQLYALGKETNYAERIASIVLQQL